MENVVYEIQGTEELGTKQYEVEIYSSSFKQWKKAVVQVVKASPESKSNVQTSFSATPEVFFGIHLLNHHTERRKKHKDKEKHRESGPKPTVPLSTLLSVSHLCPKIAKMPLSLELRAALKLLLTNEGRRTYTTHGTPRSSAGTPVNQYRTTSTSLKSPTSLPLSQNPVRRPTTTYIHSPEVPSFSRGNSLSSMAAQHREATAARRIEVPDEDVDTRTEPYSSVVARGVGQKDLLTPFQKNETAVFQGGEKVHYTENKSNLMSRNSSLANSFANSFSEKQEGIQALEELFDIEFDCVCFRTCKPRVEVRPGVHPSGSSVKEGKSSPDGSETRSTVSTKGRKLLSVFTHFHFGSKSSKSGSKVASPLTSKKTSTNTSHTSSPVSTAEMHAFPKGSEVLSVVIRCKNRNDFYELLHDAVVHGMVRRSPQKKHSGRDFDIDSSDGDNEEENDKTLPKSQWIRYVKRTTDPRNDLPFAKIPLFLWYSFIKHANSVFYCCQRGYLVVESLSEDPRMESPTRPALDRIGTFDVITTSTPQPHQKAEWDTVQLIVSPTTNHATFPDYGALKSDRENPSYSSVNANLLAQYRDIFLCVSDTHVLFVNSFGDIKLHFAHDEIVSLTYPQKNMELAATYPFMRFSVKAGEDWIEEPPLLLTFTILPLIPHTQLTASFAIITPNESEDSEDEKEDGDTILEFLHYHERREMEEVYRRKDVVVQLISTLCEKPKVRKTYKEFETVLPLLRDALLSRSDDVLFLLELNETEMLVKKEDEDPFPRQYSDGAGGKASTPSAVYEDTQRAELSLRMAVNQIPYLTEKSDLFLDEDSAEEENQYYASSKTHVDPMRLERRISEPEVLEEYSVDFTALRPQKKRSELVKRDSKTDPEL